MNVTVIFQGGEYPICLVVANRYGLTEGMEVTSKKLFQRILDDHNAHVILLISATKRHAT